MNTKPNFRRSFKRHALGLTLLGCGWAAQAACLGTEPIFLSQGSGGPTSLLSSSATLPVGFAGRAALGFGKRLTGKSKDEVTAELMDKAAQQLFTVLGELKGGAMKVGQALSVMEAA